MQNLASIREILRGRTKSSYSFWRLGPDNLAIELPGNPPKGHPVTLTAPKVMTIRPFDLPTTSGAQIRKILTANLMGYGAGDTLEIFPCIVKQSRKHSEGFAVCTTTSQLPDAAGRCWPGALLLAGGLSSGSGVTMWIDVEGISSFLWEDWVPVMGRYTAGRDPDKVTEWYTELAKRQNKADPEVVIFDVAVPEELGEIADRTLEHCRWLHGLDMSHKAVQSSIQLEQGVRTSSSVLAWVIAALIVIAGAQGLNMWHQQKHSDELNERMSEYYRATLDPTRRGNISNPVVLAREMLGTNDTEQEPHPFGAGLADLAAVIGASSDIHIDIVRYNSAGLDITGTAPDMTAVLNFRSEWESLGARAQADNTQYVSGIGYRFDVRVRWE